jgi:hypothetical protein
MKDILLILGITVALALLAGTAVYWTLCLLAGNRREIANPAANRIEMGGVTPTSSRKDVHAFRAVAGR